MMVDLGGPGTACSATRLRRLRAGELRGAELERTEQHVRECVRCQATLRELDEERARLLRDVPFEAFAAGVAEKLVRAPAPPRWLRWAPLAAAAGLLLALGTSMTLLRSDEGVRIKGGATVALYQRSGTQVLGVERKVASGPIVVRLKPAGHAYVAVVLAEPGETSLLYNGPARPELPNAFEWTGSARQATLIAVFSERPIDARALLRSGAEAAPHAAEVVRVPLERGQ
jgi:hypothetical protein